MKKTFRSPYSRGIATIQVEIAYSLFKSLPSCVVQIEASNGNVNGPVYDHFTTQRFQNCMILADHANFTTVEGRL